MKNFLKFAGAATLLSAALSPMAQAQDSNFYGDIGLNYVNNDAFDITAIQGHIGYQFNEFFGVEGELGFGLTEKKFDAREFGFTDPDLNVNAEIKLNYLAGIYGVVGTEVGDGFEIFARLGAVNADLEAKATASSGSTSASDSVSASDTGVAFGVGAKYYFDDANGVRLDYTRFQFGDNAEANTFAIGYTRKF